MRSIRFHRRVHHPVGAASLAALALLVSPLVIAPAAAQLPDPSVTPVPAAPGSGDAFVLDIESICCSTPARVIETSVTVVDGVIRVDTQTDCGPLSSTTDYRYSVAVPPLPPGEYSVEVYSQGLCNAGRETLEITDTLTVEAQGALSGIRCKPAVEPAATLLFPYFEVDPDSVQGITTMLAVTNTRAAPVLTKVTLWSDWALPVGSFHVYLTGFDVQTLNLRDVLAGRLPETGPGAVSPVGDLSRPHESFPGCGLDLAQSGSGSGFDPDLVTAALRGDRSHSECSSSDTHPDRAVGYVTVDVVRACSSLSPGDEEYFLPGGSGIATNDNALLGDFILAEPGESFAQGSPAIHLVADADAFGPGDLTFYGRYVDMDGSDARMPLGRLHGARYVQNPGFDGGTELLVWRGVVEPPEGPFQCDDLPSFGVAPWLELFATVDAFDEEENWVMLPIGTSFRHATQRVPASAVSPFGSGWLRMDLRGQGAVLSVMRALGRFSAGIQSGQLDDACQALDQALE
jgi:hypothetical protein